MNIRFLIIFFMVAGGGSSLWGQTYSMNGTPINDCSGTFFDPGGETGNYGNNQNFSTTICSDNTNGTHIRLSFSGADLAPGDALCFYDGVNLAAPLLSCHTDYNPGQPFLVQATAINPSGCLTVSFVSDAGGTGTGWAAAISCVPSCQTILADLVTTNPAALPADTGWIDICPGERVFFNGIGVYPQNNFAYNQSDLTTTFEWNFGDGGIAYGPNTSHRFDQPGGYYVQLFLTDVQGCKNTNLINQRVRVAPRPNFQVLNALDDEICAGDTLQLSATTNGNPNALINITSDTASFDVEGSRSDSLALPDGTGIPYETSVFFSEFSPGQVLTSANDLESICVNIEHSWARDVEITLTCPNGQTIILHDHPGNFGGQVFLGEPNDNDNVNPIPGLGYDYCWINNAPNPTWIQYANTVLGGSGTIPPGDYSTFDPISDLIGCPLNGEWTVTVTDWWPIDNGFIFNWSLKFKDVLYPNIEQFTPGLLTWSWNNHPSIFFSTPDSIAASPQNAGTAGYRFTIQDAFGCAWDTLITVSVLPPTHPNCLQCGPNPSVLQDTSICTGNSVQFNASNLLPPTQEIRFEAYPDYRLGNGNHPHNNPYYATVDVNSLGYSLLTLPIQQITSVCMDIETDYAGDLNIFLQAPSGQLLELSTGNGGSGDNYKITCFSPAAGTPIIGQSAPFNGTYRPEGNWNGLQGAAVNGNWALRISDGFAPSQFGVVKWWSIGFNVNNNVSYNWPNSNGLSCSNCPNPIASPAVTNTYTVSAVNAFGCQYQDTVQVTVSNFFAAPGGLGPVNQGAGSITWAWDPVPGANGYEVRIDSGPWIAANGPNSHTVSGLSLGQSVQLEVRAISPGCDPLIATNTTTYVNCTLITLLDAIGNVLCAGDSTGSVDIAAAGGTPPYSFLVNNWPVAYPSGNLINIFPEGNHFVIVRDMAGCADTLPFSIGGPAPLTLTTTTVHVDCPGLDTGSAGADATGGTGQLNYAWQACAGGTVYQNSTISNVFAGCYRVSVTDENGCQNTQTVTISEPDPFQFLLNTVDVSCQGGNDGQANVTVGGATPPYSYLWDNGQTGQTATGLDADFHFVTITDGNQCQAATFAQVYEPPVLLADSTIATDVSCFGGSNGAIRVIALGGTAPYSYVWSNGQNSEKAQNIPAGTYQVTVTDAEGCTAVAQASVQEPPAVSATFNNILSENCAGDCQGTATLVGTGGTPPYAVNWSDPGIPAGALTATGLCPGNYSITIQDTRGCSATATVPIQAAITLAANFTLQAPTCAGLSNGLASVIVSGGNGIYQYQWSNGDTGAQAAGLACGNHTLTITDGLGCTLDQAIDLDCPTTVQTGIPISTPVICFGQSNGTALVQPSGGEPPYSYLWSDANAQTTSLASNLPAGSYTVTVRDQQGCTATAAVSIQEPLVLSASATGSPSTCFGGADGAISSSIQGGIGPYLYNWSNGASTSGLMGLAAGLYTLTVSDANACSTTVTASVAQPAQGLSVTATQVQASCFNQQNGQALASASGGNGGPFQYQWSNGMSSANIMNLAPAVYTVAATDQKGCTASATLTIQQLDMVLVNAAFVPPTCAGIADAQAAVNLINGGVGQGILGNYQFIWSIPNTQSAPQVNGLIGDQTYTVTAVDQQGCTGSYTFYINEPAPITLSLSQQDARCFDSADGAAQVTGIQQAVLPVQYTWSNGASGPDLSQVPAGFYQVTATDTKGCTAVQTLEIKAPPPLQISFDITQLTCAGDANAAIRVQASGGAGGYNYLWNSGQTTDLLSSLPAGNYGLTVTDQNGCTLAGTRLIEAPIPLNLQVSAVSPECFDKSNGRLIASLSGGSSPVQYRLNDGPVQNSGIFLSLAAGIYTISATDAKGCTATRSDTLMAPPPVSVILPADTSLIFGDSLLISADVANGSGQLNYAWSSQWNTGINCVDTLFCDEIWVTPTESNTFQLVVTDDQGCKGRASIRVKVQKPRGIYVPSGFSPNGDAQNDLLIVHGQSRQVRHVTLFRIYDRWGELIYEDQNFPVNESSRGWDGSFRGKACDPGVYIWWLEAEYQDGYKEVLKGDVTLIR